MIVRLKRSRMPRDTRRYMSAQNREKIKPRALQGANMGYSRRRLQSLSSPHTGSRFADMVRMYRAFPAVPRCPAPLPLLLVLTPVPAPRQTGRDAFAPSPAVQRYRAFRDALWDQIKDYDFPSAGLWLTFALPMPASWSARKRASLLGTLHQAQTRDIDNLCKAVLDTLWPAGDGHIADIRLTKYWGVTGSLSIDWLPEYRP